MTIEDLTKEIEDILGYCSVTYNQDQPAELMERLTNLSVYLARTAELLSEAQYFYDYHLALETDKLLGLNYSGNALRDVAKGRVATHKKLLDLTERINSTITHQIDAIRTQLSYLKSLNNS